MAPTSFRRIGAAALAGVLGLAGLSGAASATASFGLTRVAGADRYGTASALAASAFPSGATSAVIARGDQFADALAGAYLGGQQSGGAPVLLTQTASVPQSTKDRLTSLGVKTVFLLGGTNAISQAAQDDLAKTYTVVRVAGANRYDTAAKVGEATGGPGVGSLNAAKTAIVASGETFPDALAAGSVSFSARFPIILTQAGSLPPESQAAITALGIKHAVVVGGTSAVGSAVVSQLTGLGATTERVAGDDRYATGTALADFANKLPGWSTTLVDLATGENFADALAGGPAAGHTPRSLLLTATAALSSATATWLQAHASTLTGGRVLGGTSAVSETAKTAAETAAGATATTTSGQLTKEDTVNHRYTFVADGATTATVVTYKSTDTFTVDGAHADMAGFDANATPADTITYTTGNPAKHELVNVNAASITSGVIGRIDESATHQTLAFINTVTADALRAGVSYVPTNATYSVDGVAAAVAVFEQSMNEGDSLAITGTAFALTNHDVTGPAMAIDKSSPVQTLLQIGALGDDPLTNQDTSYVATSSDKFVVDGVNPSDFATFTKNLTPGDTVTYKRVSVPGTPASSAQQTFTLVDNPPPPLPGQAAGTLTKNPPALPANDPNAGGSFTLAASTGSVTVNYVAGGVFKVNGSVSNEATFESNYKAGALIGYQAADAPTNTTQALELTAANLSGAVQPSSINTSETAPSGTILPHTFAVLAQNGTTVLATVDYHPSGGSDLYYVNGVSATLAQFASELDAIKAGSKAGTDLEDTTGTNHNHRLTTTASS